MNHSRNEFAPPLEWTDVEEWIKDSKVLDLDPKADSPGVRFRAVIVTEDGGDRVFDQSGPIFDFSGVDGRSEPVSQKNFERLVNDYLDYLTGPAAHLSDNERATVRIEVAPTTRLLEFRHRRHHGRSPTAAPSLPSPLDRLVGVLAHEFQVDNARVRAAQQEVSQLDDASTAALMADAHLVRDRVRTYLNQLPSREVLYDIFEPSMMPSPGAEIVDRFLCQAMVAAKSSTTELFRFTEALGITQPAPSRDGLRPR